jgi:hypothetical protein
MMGSQTPFRMWHQASQWPLKGPTCVLGTTRRQPPAPQVHMKRPQALPLLTPVPPNHCPTLPNTPTKSRRKCTIHNHVCDSQMSLPMPCLKGPTCPLTACNTAHHSIPQQLIKAAPSPLPSWRPPLTPPPTHPHPQRPHLPLTARASRMSFPMPCLYGPQCPLIRATQHCISQHFIMAAALTCPSPISMPPQKNTNTPPSPQRPHLPLTARASQISFPMPCLNGPTCPLGTTRPSGKMCSQSPEPSAPAATDTLAWSTPAPLFTGSTLPLRKNCLQGGGDEGGRQGKGV